MKTSLIAICAMLLAACSEHEKVQRAVPLVRTVMVEQASLRKELRYSASVLPDKQVDLAFRVGGFVESIRQVRGANGRYHSIEEGDLVTAGVSLAQIRPADYRARVEQAESQSAEAESAKLLASAQLNESKASEEQARLDYDRARRLFERDALTKPELDATLARHETTQARSQAMMAQIQAAQAQIRTAQALHKQAIVPLTETAVVAPFAGVLLARRVEVGSLVSPGTPAFTLADFSVVRVAFGVPDIGLANFPLGSSMEVTVEALPGTRFRGTVSTIAPSADPANRVFTIELSIPNPQLKLKPGMVASVIAASEGPAEPVPVIPLAAVVRGKSAGDHYGAFVLERSNGKTVVRFRALVLGQTVGNGVQVKEGLPTAARVVATGGLQLADGEEVKEIHEEGIPNVAQNR
jgi:multidrug efflux system membrane fusion protein